MAKQVIVVGAGAAGMSAGLAAAVHGADVVVLEKSAVVGGTTAYSGGVAWFPDNATARHDGVADSQDLALRYLESLALGDADDALNVAFVSEAARIAELLAQHTGVRWRVIDWPDYHAELPGGALFGRSVELEPAEYMSAVVARVRRDPRNPAPVSYWELANGVPPEAELQRRADSNSLFRGRGLVAALYQACVAAGVRFEFEVAARELLTRSGEVVGVATDAGTFEGRVVLATGGFEHNDVLVRHFLRGPMFAPLSPEGMDGDGLVMAMAAGAALGNMSEAWWAPALATGGSPTTGDASWHVLFNDIGRPGGILVDQYGRRFANEATNYNDLGRSLHAFDPAPYEFPRIPAWFVFDTSRRTSAPVGPSKPGAEDPDWMFSAGTLEDLSAAIGLAPDALAETVARFNGYAEKGRDPEFGRGSYPRDIHSIGTAQASVHLRPLDNPPFYAVAVYPGCLGTKGGARIDSRARVQRISTGKPITGLYAAGNVAANPFGYGYPGGGGTIGPALVFGWIAGESASTSDEPR